MITNFSGLSRLGAKPKTRAQMNTTMANDKPLFLTIKEFARLVRKHEQTVYRWIRNARTTVGKSPLQAYDFKQLTTGCYLIRYSAFERITDPDFQEQIQQRKADLKRQRKLNTRAKNNVLAKLQINGISPMKNGG